MPYLGKGSDPIFSLILCDGGFLICLRVIILLHHWVALVVGKESSSTRSKLESLD